MRTGPREREAGGPRWATSSRPGRAGVAGAVLLAAAWAVAAGCGEERPPPPLDALTAPGVSRELATWRAAAVDSVRYALRFSIPDDRSDPVRGRAAISFRLLDASRPVVLDFAGPADGVRAVTSGRRPVEHRVVDGHLVVPADSLDVREGRTRLSVAFVAGDGPLNRNETYLYTLFVPARAREAFPSFDQPDLKARFRLTLELPAAWEAVSNTPALEEGAGRETGSRAGASPKAGSGEAASPETEPGGTAPPEAASGDDRRTVRFAETRPIPTYLFAFAAGAWKMEEATRDGRSLRMYHRETDTAKVARNREAIFDLHARALAWLEAYTGIPYPFSRFDFVLVPSFQYGGMEHPGAVFYRASGLLLDESPTLGDRLGRASVISHETAHMWFGDLVTMEWFDDVWMKEVFANFMAARIVHPSFPELDHELRFLLAHYPAAYAVDRSEGTHPIRQELANLDEAGNLYGAIIYQKAPVVMRALEGLVGDTAFRDGLREYLRENAFGNASWPDLIRVLDDRSREDLARWSRMWVGEAGRPTVRVRLQTDTAGRMRRLDLVQSDPRDLGRVWNQELWVAVTFPRGNGTGVASAEARAAARQVRPQEVGRLLMLPAHLRGRVDDVQGVQGLPAPEMVLPGGRGRGYALFRLDPGTRDVLLSGVERLPDPVLRASAWLALWDGVLEGDVAPEDYLEAALRTLPGEPEELLVEAVLGDVRELFWRYLSPGERERWVARVEEVLWRGVTESGEASRRSAYFRAYRAVALSEPGVGRLEGIWRREDPPAGLELSEEDYADLAQALAVRGVGRPRQILRTQADRMENPDRRERFRWVVPALSPDPAERDSFFAALAEPENRRHEPWVLEGLRYLHHPLRAGASRKHVRPGLELLEEVHATGDIFFPKRWLDATLSGHASSEVAATVRAYLEEHPDLPGFLRDKVLQAGDPVFRAARIRLRVGATGGPRAGGG